jgi:hypothetical protein
VLHEEPHDKTEISHFTSSQRLRSKKCTFSHGFSYHALLQGHALAGRLAISEGQARYAVPQGERGVSV